MCLRAKARNAIGHSSDASVLAYSRCLRITFARANYDSFFSEAEGMMNLIADCFQLCNYMATKAMASAIHRFCAREYAGEAIVKPLPYLMQLSYLSSQAFFYAQEHLHSLMCCFFCEYSVSCWCSANVVHVLHSHLGLHALHLDRHPSLMLLRSFTAWVVLGHMISARRTSKGIRYGMAYNVRHINTWPMLTRMLILCNLFQIWTSLALCVHIL